VEERLRYILTTVNEWLKFAEAKNGALLVADIAILFGVFSLLNESTGQRVFIYLAIVLVIVSAISSLVSFIPQLKVFSFTSKKKTGEKASLIFYRHIAEYEPQSYVEALHAEAGAEPTVIASIEVDYAQQIIMNSQIAVRKYLCFNVGLCLTILALLFLLVASLMSIEAV
jgi:hypothetical protein